MMEAQCAVAQTAIRGAEPGLAEVKNYSSFIQVLSIILPFSESVGTEKSLIYLLPYAKSFNFNAGVAFSKWDIYKSME